MDQTKNIELQKKRLESAYDKGGTVEVYGECFKLIGVFCLLLLHVSIIFLNLQPPNVYNEWARSPCNGNHFSSFNCIAISLQLY